MKDLDKINVGISANDGSGNTLRDAFIKVNENFTEVEQAIDSLDSVKVDVDELKSDNVLQKSDIANLKNKDTFQDTEITLLKQKDLAQDNRLASLEGDVQGFVGDLSSVNGRIDNQTTEIGNLKSKDTQQDNNILTINGKIVALEGDVSTLKQGHITQANQIVNINDKMIRTVNGVGPDINGNVIVSGGSGGGGIGTVTSVNGVGPDGSGAVTIPVGISDAPSDGKEYVRKNATWSEAQGGGDVPTLDEVLGKGNTSIKSIRMDSDPEDWGDRSFMLDGDGLRITETSSGDVRGAFKGGYSYTEVNHRDTSIYLYNGEIEITKPLELPVAVKDVQAPTFGQVKQWVTENIDSGGITDAPKDGKLYGRKDETWSEVPIPGVVIRGTNALGGITYYLSGKGSSYTTKEALDLRISTKGTNEDALGLFATAIGYNTQALGDQSFSIGSQATAFGERSIAGGVTAMAMGMDSLALGRGTRANAKDSVALGPYSEASGVGASALGYWNEANEFGVTTVGMYCKAGPTRTTRVVGDAIFKVGVGTGSSSANRKDGLIVTNDGKVSAPSQNLDMITDAKQLATKEYVDSVATSGGGGIPEAPNNGKLYGRKNESWSEVTGGSEYELPIASPTILGGIKVGDGLSILPDGTVSVEGGGSSTPITFDATKYAYYDELSTVSTVGNGSVAIGRLTATNPSTATGANATSIGSGSRATNSRTIALGYQPEASGSNAVAIGSQAKGTATSAVGIGSSANALGSYAVSIGHNSKSAVGVQGQSAISIGYTANGNNKNTIAIGTSSVARNSDSIAIGSSAQCSGSIAIGKSSYSGGTSTAVIGDNSDAKGSRSSILGPDNINKYYGCTTVGIFSEGVKGAQGEYEKVVGSPSFVVGAGSSDTERLNAFTVLNTGDAVLPIASSGLVLTSPNGTAYKLTVDDSGEPVFTAV